MQRWKVSVGQSAAAARVECCLMVNLSKPRAGNQAHSFHPFASDHIIITPVASLIRRCTHLYIRGKDPAG